MRKTAALLFVCVSLFLSGSASAESPDGGRPIAVIVNKSNPAADISLEELSRFYKGKVTKWSNGTAVIVINRESTSAIRAVFYESALKAKVSESFLQVGSGLPFMTNIQTTSALVKRIVAQVPGAIGYIYLNEADDTVKVLKIDGLEPGKAGYILVEAGSGSA